MLYALGETVCTYHRFLVLYSVQNERLDLICRAQLKRRFAISVERVQIAVMLNQKQRAVAVAFLTCVVQRRVALRIFGVYS